VERTARTTPTGGRSILNMKTIRIEIEINHLHEDIVTDENSQAICDDAALAVSKTVDDDTPSADVVQELLKEAQRRFTTINARKTN
jgi:hypothetical protein